MAKAAKKKAYREFVSPVGQLRYPKLNEPDTRGEFPSGRYQTEVVFDEVGLATMKKMLSEFAKEQLPHVKEPKLPIKVGKKDGVVSVFFKGGWDKKIDEPKKPLLIDSQRQPIPAAVTIGAGTTAKVGGTMSTYENGPNRGVNIYLDAVQVLELVEARGGLVNRFADEDGFVAETASSGNDDDAAGNNSADALSL